MYKRSPTLLFGYFSHVNMSTRTNELIILATVHKLIYIYIHTILQPNLSSSVPPLSQNDINKSLLDLAKEITTSPTSDTRIIPDNDDILDNDDVPINTSTTSPIPQNNDIIINSTESFSL